MPLHLRILCLLLIPLALCTLVQPSPAARAAGAQPASTTVPAQPPALELAAHVPGPIGAIDVQGPLAALLDNGELLLLNVADPAQPREIGHLPLPNPSLLHDIELAGDRAYIAWGESDGLETKIGGVRIVDISDPTAPVEIGAIHLPEVVWQVAVDGHYAYLLCDGSGTKLRVYDIANPALPVAIATFDAPASNTMTVLHDPATGWLDAYLIGGMGVAVVDLSHPEAPTVRGIYRSMHGLLVGGDIYSTLVNGSARVYAYLADVDEANGGLRIIDMTNPVNPVELAQLTNWGKRLGIVLAGHYAFMTSYEGSGYHAVVHLLDLSNPVAPTEVNRSVINQFAGFAMQEPYVYFGTEDGFVVATSPAQGGPTTMGMFAGGWFAAVTGGINQSDNASRYLLSAVDRDLAIIDAFNPVAPRRLGKVTLNQSEGFCVATAGNYAVVMDLLGYLSSVDISDPANPRLLATIKLPSQAWDVQLRGVPGAGPALAFVAGTQGSFDIVDLTQPSVPVRVGTYTFAGAVKGIALSGTVAYLVVGWESYNTLVALNIADPAHPSPLGSIRLENTLLDAYSGKIVVHGTYAYISMGQDGLQVVNVADPSHPQVAGRFTFPGTRLVYGLALLGSILYVAAQPDILLALDLSNPATPAIAATYPVPALGTQLVVANGYLYAGGWGGGMLIWHLGSDTGAVQDVNGRPVAGVEVAVDGDPTSATGMPGTYNIAGGPAAVTLAGTVTLTPKLSGYTFWPPSRLVPATASASNQNFTLLPPPVTGMLQPDLQATLIYTDTQGLPTRIDIPAGTVTTSTALTITPTVGIAAPAVTFAGHAFELGLAQSGIAATDVRFSQPLTVTIAYSAVDVRLVRDKTQLALWWWNGSAWEDAAASCATSVRRDLAARSVQIPICYSGQYALVGPTNHTYLSISMH